MVLIPNSMCAQMLPRLSWADLTEAEFPTYPCKPPLSEYGLVSVLLPSSMCAQKLTRLSWAHLTEAEVPHMVSSVANAASERVICSIQTKWWFMTEPAFPDCDMLSHWDVDCDLQAALGVNHSSPDLGHRVCDRLNERQWRRRETRLMRRIAVASDDK